MSCPWTTPYQRGRRICNRAEAKCLPGNEVEVTIAADDTPRLAWLDGLRGIAAIQVVLLHYASAFVPAIGLLDPTRAHDAWEGAFIHTPLFLPFDGYSAVYVFFILSGVALTYSFGARPRAVLTGVARRVIRLGLPMIGGILFGAVCYGLLPDVRVRASQLTGSVHWLGVVTPERISPLALLHQIGLEGLFAGYKDSSLLPQSLRTWFGLVPMDQSFDVPLWTLHVEFFGSLFVLGLVTLREAVGHRTYVVVCVMLAGALATSSLELFLIGHIAAGWLKIPPNRRSNWMVGACLLCLGVVLCTAPRFELLVYLRRFLPAPFVGEPVGSEVLQRVLGAVGLFLGISLLPGIQKNLGLPVVRWLGKISFSLYLIHFPLLFTVVCNCFVVLADLISYAAAITIVTIGGILLSVAIAVAFERLVDRPAIALSRKVSVSGGCRQAMIRSG
jgi:peptidoglycan/LPS O-acetylase OafA/YrhL